MKLHVLHEGQTIVFDLVVNILDKKYNITRPRVPDYIGAGASLADMAASLKANTRFVGLRGSKFALGRIINWPDMGKIVAFYHKRSGERVHETWDSADPDILDKVLAFFEKAEEEAAPVMATM